MKISHPCQWSSLQWFLESITKANLLSLVIQTILEVWRNCPSRELQFSCGKQRKKRLEEYISCLMCEGVDIDVGCVCNWYHCTVMTEAWSWNCLENSISKCWLRKYEDSVLEIWGCPCLGEWSNLIWRRGWYLFEMLAIQRDQWSPREEGAFLCRG